MRVIYITAALPYGTDEAFIVAEIQELIRCGHQVLVIPRSPRGRILHGRELVSLSKPEPLCSMRVLAAAAAKAIASPASVVSAARPLLASKAVKNLAVMPKAVWLASIAREWGADHIHCHWAGTTASMAMAASALSGIPWSLTLHRWDIVENNLLAAKVRHAAFARFISEDGLKMARDLGVPADRTRVIHMGVPLPSRVAPAGGPDSPRVVLCPARLVEVKGHRYLIEAWKILKRRGIDGELWLAGDGELRRPLEALAREFDSVKFLGALPHDELLAIYSRNSVSAVVMASLDLGGGCHEGIPVALIEAMSYGIPVIATRAGGTPELIRAGTGLLIPPADPDALAVALERILNDGELRRTLGPAGRRRAFEEFDITRVVSELARNFGVTEQNLVTSAG
jgi:colanic acid/amylovoran biosynthesis glycosyltransferase